MLFLFSAVSIGLGYSIPESWVKESPSIPAADETQSRKDQPLQLGEVTVTAEKRAQNIQDTPVSITALDAGIIEPKLEVVILFSYNYNILSAHSLRLWHYIFYFTTIVVLTDLPGWHLTPRIEYLFFCSGSGSTLFLTWTVLPSLHCMETVARSCGSTTQRTNLKVYILFSFCLAFFQPLLYVASAILEDRAMLRSNPSAADGAERMEARLQVVFVGRVFFYLFHPFGSNTLNLGGMGAGPHPQPTGTGGCSFFSSAPRCFAFSSL